MAKRRAGKKQTTRYVQRSRRTHKTARAAWNDIARSRGLRPGQVARAHTRTHWRWRIK